MQEIREGVEGKMAEGLAALGGQDKVVRWLGCFSPAWSRAIHDIENKQGCGSWPRPSRALDGVRRPLPRRDGSDDRRTGQPRGSREAVLAGKALDKSYEIAETEAKDRDAAPCRMVPEMLYFDFNQDALRFEVMAMLYGTATYMNTTPSDPQLIATRIRSARTTQSRPRREPGDAVAKFLRRKGCRHRA
jgi:hypothetical protein